MFMSDFKAMMWNSCFQIQLLSEFSVIVSFSGFECMLLRHMSTEQLGMHRNFVDKLITLLVMLLNQT